MPDAADLDAAPGEFAPGGCDVGDGQVDGAGRSGRRVGEPGADLDRAGRTGWSQLDDPEARRWVVIDVQGEAGLPRVERFGPVDVADRDGDDLNLVSHVTRYFGHRSSYRTALQPAGPGQPIAQPGVPPGLWPATAGWPDQPRPVAEGRWAAAGRRRG